MTIRCCIYISVQEESIILEFFFAIERYYKPDFIVHFGFDVFIFIVKLLKVQIIQSNYQVDSTTCRWQNCVFLFQFEFLIENFGELIPMKLDYLGSKMLINMIPKI